MQMTHVLSSVKIYDSVWKLSSNNELNCFKILAPGSKDALHILDQVCDTSREELNEAGGTMHVFVITADFAKWSKRNGKKSGRNRKITACVIFSSPLRLYQLNPLDEERKLLYALSAQHIRDISLEKKCASVAQQPIIKANWRLGQSMLVAQPNVAVALVSSKSVLDTEILNRKASGEVDEAVLLFSIPLNDIMNADKDVENLLAYSRMEIAGLLRSMPETGNLTQLGRHSLSALTIEHHLSMCSAMAPQFKESDFSRPVDDLHMLLIVQQSQFGVWIDIPGGKRDLAESTEEAGCREIQEECGIDYFGRCRQVYARFPNRKLARFGHTCKLIVVEMSKNSESSESESTEVEKQLAKLKI